MNRKSVALVTGASSGIGKATAVQLAADGFVVYGVARRLEKMEELNQHGIITLKMDITKEDDVAQVIETIQRDHGGVDVLVNNAGFGSFGAMEDTTIEDARYQFEVNLFGLARLTKAVVPWMREQKSGYIVNVSSVGGKIYTPFGSWYHATKHALEGWSDCLRLELAPFGIHVIIVEPGFISTEFGDVALGLAKERSGNSIYADRLNAIVSAMERRRQQRDNSSPPETIATAISRAVQARRPKTRYSAGFMAKILLFVRRRTSDRAFDRAILRQFK